ncbi:uncharacterized protein LOC116211093 [Punica granatum]|uniref:Uncharacterized protein LOC116211093 n=1 Tax=Punica granatum TaxID=22663 RepID=A0A6P8E091_PUNGR|nr:uncharacterized protein LOC116211093 [Punica granatum]
MSKVPPEHLQEANFPQRCPQDEQEGSGGCCYTRVTDLVRRGHDTHIPFNVHRRRKRDNSGNGGLPILGSGPVGLGDEVLSDNPELRVPLPRELVSSLVVGSHVLLILCPLMVIFKFLVARHYLIGQLCRNNLETVVDQRAFRRRSRLPN